MTLSPSQFTIVTEAVRKILGLVAFQDKHGHWFGHDTDCGTDARITGDGVTIVSDMLENLLSGTIDARVVAADVSYVTAVAPDEVIER